MTCKEFEFEVVDAARGRGAASAEALEHAGGCAHCAARLDAERALTSDLRALAAAAPAAGAPPATEARLLAAFRDEARAPAPQVVPFRRRTIAALAAAAALGAVGLGALALSVARPAGPERAATKARVVPVAPAARPVPDVVAPTPSTVTPDLPDVLVTPGRSDTHAIRTSAPVRPRPAAPRPAPAAPREVTTEFFPLVSASDSEALEGGQLVRMELPRAQLAALGFHLNAERVDERITADVLLGHDGVARAIRFVQPSSALSEESRQ